LDDDTVLAELRLACVLKEENVTRTKALESMSPVGTIAVATAAAAGSEDEGAWGRAPMLETSAEEDNRECMPLLVCDSDSDEDRIHVEAAHDGLSRRKRRKAVRKRDRRKFRRTARSGDNPCDAAKVAGAADPAKTAEDVFLRDPHEGSDGKEVTTSLCVGRLASAVIVPCVVKPNAETPSGLSRHSALAATGDACDEARRETDPEAKPEATQQSEVLKAYTAKNRRVRFEAATKGAADTVEVILDSGSDGHILPVSVMTKVRRAPPGSCVLGVGGGNEPLTHTGYVELLDGQAFAPQSGQFLVSIPLLDRGGCSVKIKSGRMRVYNADGSIKLEGHLNRKNMYVYDMLTVDGQARAAATANAGELKEVADPDDDDTALQLEALNKTNIKVQSTTEHFTPRARKRALAVLDLHENVGHPCDAVFGEALDGGCFSGIDLTSADLRVARILYGPCDACIEGKMTAPREPTSTNYRDSGVGHTIY
jgi:hypothetical protein